VTAPEPRPCQLPWRVGRKVGRTIYQQVGPEPSDADQLIGVMDTPELAAEVVTARNFRFTRLNEEAWRALGCDEDDPR
jgi:hypothetical protein